MTDMTDDEALETLFAMANVQDGYAKKATDRGLKIIHKANAKAQREVAATIKDLRARLASAEAERDQARADAQAAVALVVERAVEAAYEADSLELSIHGANVIAERILALADADGLAAVEALRAERDAFKASLASAKEIALVAISEADDLRDRLAAELAAAEQREARLVGARDMIVAVEDAINLPWTGAGVDEPLPVRDYRHWLYRIWSPLARAAFAEVQARDDASTAPDTTWHERRTMLPDGDARKEGGK